jgi:hypothetical protein
LRGRDREETNNFRPHRKRGGVAWKDVLFFPAAQQVALRYRSVRCGYNVQYGMVQHGTVQHAVWYGTAPYNIEHAVWYGTAPYNIEHDSA